MFNSNKNKNIKVDTLIGNNTEITGNVKFSGGLHIDGSIIGNILADDESSSIMILSDKGKIEGEVRVPNLVINGKVEGDVYAFNKVELANQARIKGNVFYNLIEMEIGAEINGNLVHQDKEEKKLHRVASCRPHGLRSFPEC